MAKISNLDFYAILGVHPNAEDIVIRAAFKALAQRYHPDRFNGAKDEAHRRMSDLTSAYETLADPARRRKYDRRRGLAGRQARFYFKNPARDRQQPYSALAARIAARKAQRYRMAVYVLMVVVVILSGFNLRQHSAQIRELFASNRASPSTIAVTVPIAAPASTLDTTLSGAGETPTASTTNVRILPMSQGNTRPISPAAVETTPIAPRVETQPIAPPVETQPIAPRVDTQPIAPPVETQPIAPHAADASVEAASPAPPLSGVETAPPAPLDTAPKDYRQPPPKPVVAKAVEPERKAVPPKPAAARAVEPARPAAVVARPVEPDRPAAPPSARTDGDRCTAAVAALGLCNRTGNAQGQ